MSSRVPSSDSTKDETYKIIHRLNAKYAEQPASYLRTHLLFPLREISFEKKLSNYLNIL